MKTIILTEEDATEEISLIALYSAFEIYRVVYLINRVLETSLKREADVDVQHKNGIALHPLYHYIDQKNLVDYYLVANKAETKPTKKEKITSLFQEEERYLTFLIPEQKKVNYFLEIKGIDNLTEVVTKLKTIRQLSAVATVEITSLRSYKNLIFD